MDDLDVTYCLENKLKLFFRNRRYKILRAMPVFLSELLSNLELNLIVAFYKFCYLPVLWWFFQNRCKFNVTFSSKQKNQRMLYLSLLLDSSGESLSNSLASFSPRKATWSSCLLCERPLKLCSECAWRNLTSEVRTIRTEREPRGFMLQASLIPCVSLEYEINYLCCLFTPPCLVSCDSWFNHRCATFSKLIWCTVVDWI